jgi:phosphate uptake regulator
MEKRKLILFGKNSIIITLPSKFLEKNNLRKGDVVYLEEAENNLIVKGDFDKKNNEKTGKIYYNNKPIKLLNKEVISYYLKNFKYIEIVGKNLLDKMDEIKIIKNKLSSIEITSLSNEKIILTDLTNPQELEIEKIISKLIDMILVMFENIEDENSNLNIIFEIDQSVNKLQYLGFKAINYSIDNKLEKDIKNLMEYRKIIVALEAIGDIIKRISRILLRIKKDEFMNLKSIIINTKEYFIFITKILEKDINYENNLSLYLDKKNSILKSIDIKKEEIKLKIENYVLVAQHLKNICGELDKIIQGIIDINVVDIIIKNN